MVVLAVGFTGVSKLLNLRVESSQYVVRLRNSFQMIWVHTRMHATQVVYNYVSGQQHVVDELVDSSMRGRGSS